MTGIVERYLSLSPNEQRIVRTACFADVPAAFGLLRLYFPQMTPADLQTLKEYIASQKPSA